MAAQAQPWITGACADADMQYLRVTVRLLGLVGVVAVARVFDQDYDYWRGDIHIK
jgi:hypothetical protein